MSDKATELFDVFVQAKTALEELPKTKAALADAEELAKSYADDLTREREAKSRADAEIAQLRADLAAREAALADATKSHSESQRLLNGLRDMLGFNHRADSPIQPAESAPVVEAQASNTEAPAPQAQPQEAPTTNENPTTAQPVESSSNSANGSDATDPDGSAYQRQNVPQPTEVPNAGPTVNPSADSSQTTSHSPTEPNDSAATASTTQSSGHEGQGAPHPTAPSSTDSGTNAQTENASTNVSAGSTDGHREYSGKDYGHKPEWMTWNEFHSKGGTVPYWVTDWSAT